MKPLLVVVVVVILRGRRGLRSPRRSDRASTDSSRSPSTSFRRLAGTSR
jgi:hypothetical protein